MEEKPTKQTTETTSEPPESGISESELAIVLDPELKDEKQKAAEKAQKRKLSTLRWLVISGAIILSGLLRALSVHCFVIPHNFAPGGATGVATMLQSATGINSGIWMLAINAPLLVAAFFRDNNGNQYRNTERTASAVRKSKRARLRRQLHSCGGCGRHSRRRGNRYPSQSRRQQRRHGYNRYIRLQAFQRRKRQLVHIRARLRCRIHFVLRVRAGTYARAFGSHRNVRLGTLERSHSKRFQVVLEIRNNYDFPRGSFQRDHRKAAPRRNSDCRKGRVYGCG